MFSARYRTALCLLAALAVGTGTTVRAQVALSLHGTVASTTLDDSKLRPGLGAALKVFAGKNLALGGAAKFISTSYNAASVGGQTIRANGYIVPLTGVLDVYLTGGAVRPYIGAEAGVYILGNRLELNGNEISNQTSTRFGATPKLGLAFALGNLGVFVEGNYHFIFGSKDGSVNTGSVSNISFENPSKLFALNAGLTFGFPKSGD